MKQFYLFNLFICCQYFYGQILNLSEGPGDSTFFSIPQNLNIQPSKKGSSPYINNNEDLSKKKTVYDDQEEVHKEVLSSSDKKELILITGF